jgi:histone deacetylase 11
MNKVMSLTRLPIIYSPRYDIRVLGIEKLHPFDSEKYGKIFRYLVNAVGIDEEAFYAPDPVSEETLLTVHSVEYLNSLKKSVNIALIAEVNDPRLRTRPRAGMGDQPLGGVPSRES